MRSARILESSVWRGMPSFAAAPLGPATRPWVAVSAASIVARSWSPAAGDQERATIEAALTATQGRVAGPKGAAAKLGMPRQTLDSKIRALRIDKLKFRPR